VAEGDAARRNFPALVLVGLHLLQLQMVDVESERVAGLRLIALPPALELYSGHAVSRKIRYFQDHLVPRMVLHHAHWYTGNLTLPSLYR